MVIDDKKIAEYKRLRAVVREHAAAELRAMDAKEPDARLDAISEAWDRARTARNKLRADIIGELEAELDSP